MSVKQRHASTFFFFGGVGKGWRGKGERKKGRKFNATSAARAGWLVEFYLRRRGGGRKKDGEKDRVGRERKGLARHRYCTPGRVVSSKL